MRKEDAVHRNRPRLRFPALVIVWAGALAFSPVDALPGRAFAQSSSKVDFGRDVRPLLAEHCYECHGPDEQKNGFRLDRRSRAFQGVLRPNIIPGDSEASRLYVKISSGQLGTQMPPRAPLAPDQIALLKNWIDQGAPWPDTLANEADWPKPDPAAVRMIDAVRLGDRPAVLASIDRDPRVLDGVDSDGSTPLMAAALYGDTALMQRMLEAGANPNAVSHAGSTALMLALDDLEAVKLLLRHRADPNALSDFKRSPLQMAAAQRDGTAVMKALIDGGAEAKLSSLVAAANAGNPPAVRLLLTAEAVDNGDAAIASLRMNCLDCFDAIVPRNACLRCAMGS
jgi:ankyrin repeat protein